MSRAHNLLNSITHASENEPQSRKGNDEATGYKGRNLYTRVRASILIRTNKGKSERARSNPVVLTGKVLFPLSYSRGGGKKFTCQFYPAQGNTIQGGHVTCRTSADGLYKQVMWLSKEGGFDGWHKQVMWLTRKGNFDGLHKLLKNALS